MKCEVCSQQETKYECPRCTLKYCSLPCYRSSTHSRCLEAFAMQHIQDAQKGTPFQQEQSREEVLHILKRIYEDDDTFEYEETTLEEDEEVQRIVAQFQPWWVKNVSFSEIRNLPSFLSLSKRPPSEFIWNNLVELVSAYCFNFRLQLGDEEESEFQEGILNDSRILGDPSFKHYASAKEALLFENVDDVCCLLIDPRKIEHCLARLVHVFNKRDLIRRKLFYYQCWFHDELNHHRELTFEILQSLTAIIVSNK